MREIKFRAWDKENQRMIYPEVTTDVCFEIKEDGMVVYDLSCESNKYGTYPFLSVAIMQYIGINDINGQEICEGDIIKCIVNNETIYGVVQYDTKWCAWILGKNIKSKDGWHNIVARRNTTLFTQASHKEVVGNVYENRELLEEE